MATMATTDKKEIIKSLKTLDAAETSMATTNKKKRPEPSAPGSDSEYDPLRSKSRPSNSDGGTGTSITVYMDFKIHADPDSEVMKSLLPDSEIVKLLKMIDAAETFRSRDPKPIPVPLPLRRSSPYCKEHFHGFVAGCVVFSYQGIRIDCTQSLAGVGMVPTVDYVSDVTSDALFILIVENDDAFVRLAMDRFYKRIPCIIITSNGYLDVFTRRFLKMMKTELKLPVLALVDCNPLGLKILSVHMCGSKEDSSDLSIPDIKWLGLLPRDLDKHQIPERSRGTMTEKNMKKARHLLEEDFVKKNPAWVEQLELMVNSKEKTEIQALSLLGCEGEYLSRVYLPHKIQHQDWL